MSVQTLPPHGTTSLRRAVEVLDMWEAWEKMLGGPPGSPGPAFAAGMLLVSFIFLLILAFLL